MFKNILEGTQGVDIYGIFSLVIFFAFFIVIIVWLTKIKKSYLENMSNLPFHDDEQAKTQNELTK